MADLEKLVNVSAGTAQKNLLLRDLRNHSVLIPGLKVQANIVVKLDLLLEKTKPIQLQYQQELDRLDELKKSTLQKAFNGELTSSKKAVA
jgi:type I restriction enzyme S subunit